MTAKTTPAKKTAAPAEKVPASKLLTGKAKAEYDKRVAAEAEYTASVTTPAKKATPAKKTLPQPDGFPIGLTVVSSKDGQTYTVCGPDKSSLYVAVKNAEGKRFIRSIKTLTAVKTAAKKTVRKTAAKA